ncbi:alpha/beta fold hydrolase [Candidatus Fermentibacteria bacterium]|nr:alpha/beta fold hydrolase [Candidatus Fermentibacteria bacterium]
MSTRWLFAIAMVTALILASCGEDPGQAADISGQWRGEILIAGVRLGISVGFEGSGETLSGTIDIPMQGAFGLNLSNLFVRSDSVGFDLPSGLGTASFRGTVSGDSIWGTFEQGMERGTFTLARMSAEDLPYHSEDVEMQGDDYVLSGTLTIPEGEPPFPCVVLLSGSGLQERNENVFGFEVFGTLADHLTRSGIAVLRFDDRGFARSTGSLEGINDSSMAVDAGLALDLALADERIDSGAVGLLGHSEGSNIAFMQAVQRPADVAFVISMAGPALDGYHLILDQLEVILELQGHSEEEIAEKLALQRQVMDAVLAGEDLSSLDTLFRRQVTEQLDDLSEEELAQIGDVDTYVEMAVQQSMSQVSSPWFYNFLSHDPTELVARVDCPVLALFGSLDVQVTAEANLEPMREALEDNPDAEVIVVEGANHLFQAASTGGVDEYPALEKDFIEGFKRTVSDWILENT